MLVGLKRMNVSWDVSRFKNPWIAAEYSSGSGSSPPNASGRPGVDKLSRPKIKFTSIYSYVIEKQPIDYRIC